MKEIFIFAGTTEGRRLAEQLLATGQRVHISVATEYGEEVLLKQEHLTIHQGRLDRKEMEALLKEMDLEAVVDATHPYAVEVSRNIQAACAASNRLYLRLLRTTALPEQEDLAVYVSSIQEAIFYLNQREGNILFTTGSKDLKEYTQGIKDKSRIYARILADGATVENCKEWGLSGKQIICMQGPFSAELNAAMLRQVQASYLLTKDTGVTGGFPEKLAGARLAGAKAVVIRRPVEETGYSMAEILEKLGIPTEPEKRKITLLGIGMGSLQDLTLEAKKACEEAEVILGAARMTEALEIFQKECCSIYKPEEILKYLRKHPEKKHIVVAFSGDIGFYSGTKKLLQALEELPAEMNLIPGISSVVYFAAKLRISWEDMKLVSIHGREQNLLGAVKAHEKVFSLAGYAQSIRMLAKELLDNGLEEITMSVGCQLSYPEESIESGTPKDFLQYEKEGLCVVVLQNPQAREKIVTHGLPDDMFLRGKAPMTKEEIRSISLSKLTLKKNSIVYDIGAGTGSIGLECAWQMEEGLVYAIEKKAEALELLSQNQNKLGISNFRIVAGTAPQALESLPAPTHAFIGGSSGNMREIVSALLEKNPSVRIVINCIALETVAEVMALLKEIPFEHQEVVQVSVGKSKLLGNYHMMMGQNPVFIITLQRDCHENT